MAVGEFDAGEFIRGSRADEYVRKIDLPGLASEGGGESFINNMIAGRTAALRPTFNRLRIGAGLGVSNRLGEETITGQKVKAQDSATTQIFGQVAGIHAGAEDANERIRAQAEQAYLGHLSFMDNLEFQARTAQEELDMAREDREFGFGEAMSIASMVL